MEAEGEERQQMKWFAFGLLVLVFAYLFSPRGLLLFIVLALLPVAVGIAILKYGLYHLDIINRALVYGILTALLALVYFGGVTATQAIFRARRVVTLFVTIERHPVCTMMMKEIR
jgi:hypothetical protein